MAIDIGAEAKDRGNYVVNNRTIINKDNPANASGTITSVEIWADTNLEGCRVGTFYTTNGNTLRCRDSEAIAGTITAGSKVTKAVTIAVEIGDYIGMYAFTGYIERDTSGYGGIWWVAGEYIDPSDETSYSLSTGDAISLYGTGEEAAAAFVGSRGFIIG